MLFSDVAAAYILWRLRMRSWWIAIAAHSFPDGLVHHMRVGLSYWKFLAASGEGGIAGAT